MVNGVASPATEKVLYTGNQVQLEDGTGGNYDHAGNDLKVGPDGKLWWSVGDNVPAISNGENLDNIYGKILRFNLDGSVPADNPFVNVAGAVPYIYAYGLRNPWRFTFLPTGQAMTEDTGSNYWEDLDTIQAGGNYGWPFKEGDCGSCGYLNPAYAYGHFPTDGATSAIAAYSGSTFPSAYDHVVFFGDYVRNDIEAVTFDPTYRTEVVRHRLRPQRRDHRRPRRGPGRQPVLRQHLRGHRVQDLGHRPLPAHGIGHGHARGRRRPLAVQFSSAGSHRSLRPCRSPTSWNFGDGSPVSTAANPVHTYSSPRAPYTATLTVEQRRPVGLPPPPQVVVGRVPAGGHHHRPGHLQTPDQTVSFSGRPPIPPTVPCPPRPTPGRSTSTSTGSSGPPTTPRWPTPSPGPPPAPPPASVTIPTDPSQVPDSFYRITLSVTDSQGLTTVVTRDLHPNLATWSTSTNVARHRVLGRRELGDRTGHLHRRGRRGPRAHRPAPGPDGGRDRYRLVGWSDGSALTDTVTAGSGPTSSVALYEPVVNSVPVTRGPAPTWAPPSRPAPPTTRPADGSFYLDGGGADVFGANDQFHYVYQTLNGDGSITARVRYQSDSAPGPRPGS